MIIDGSGSGKTNALLNLINEQNDIDKIYLYAKNLGEPKYEFLIKKHEDVRINYCNDPNAFTDCSNTMDEVYENINNYNPNRRRKILIVFDNMIADMSNKKFQAIIKELFIRCRKDVRLNLTHYLIMKINNRKELQNIANNILADTDYKDFVSIYRECTRKLYYFLTIDTTLPANDPLRFRKKNTSLL